MFKWEHEYEDYNNFKRTEVFYFNFTKAEIVDLEWRTPGGLENYFTNIMRKLDGQGLADAFKLLIQKSYGVKDPEGRRFIKNQAVLVNFTQTEAYSDLYIQLASDSDFASKFINGIFPKEIVAEAHKQKDMANKAGITQLHNNPVNQPQQPAGYQTPEVPMVEGQVSNVTETPFGPLV